MFADPLVVPFGDPSVTFRLVDLLANKTVRVDDAGGKLTISHQPGEVPRSMIRYDAKVLLEDGETYGEASAYIVFVRPKTQSLGNQATFLADFIAGISAEVEEVSGSIKPSRFVALEP